ncbi:MAG: hypothetical protein CSB47_03745 [Proteobacteria bacterium]|nr:MAG: hypothetical protein CSB47_03745 [Pseudomonadota bacterium]
MLAHAVGRAADHPLGNRHKHSIINFHFGESSMNSRILALSLILLSTPAIAADTSLAGLLSGVIATVLYSLIGIVMATIGFKVVDLLTPGNLAEEVAHKGNRALAILAGSMILGVCIIIASAVIG